jgi:hypothetical protein
MFMDFDYIATYAESQESATAEPWKTYWKHFKNLARNTGTNFPVSPPTEKYTCINGTIGHFFLQSISTKIDMVKYHDTCAPKYCEFMVEPTVNLTFLIGVVIGVAGSISGFLKSFCGAMAAFESRKKNNKEVDDETTAEGGNNIEMTNPNALANWQKHLLQWWCKCIDIISIVF